MAAYFFDSSAVVKRYVRETGTVWVLSVSENTPWSTARRRRVIKPPYKPCSMAASHQRASGEVLDDHRPSSTMGGLGSTPAGRKSPGDGCARLEEAKQMTAAAKLVGVASHDSGCRLQECIVQVPPDVCEHPASCKGRLRGLSCMYGNMSVQF